MKNETGISVIIPNYNGERLFPLILPPLYKALININLPYEVIISDDCSTDDSLKYLKAQYPEIIVLESTKNRGFSPTANRGMFASKFSLIFLMNSDVILTENYFDHLIGYFPDADTFGVMGRIIGWDDNIIQDGGKYPEVHGFKIKTSGNYIPLDGGDDKYFTTYLSGANALMDREKVLLLGGFDELFEPFYSEDFELSLRAWRMKMACYYEHRAICRHDTSVTIKSKHKKDYINSIYYRNKMFLHAIHFNGAKYGFWYIQNVLELLMQLVLGKFFFWRAFKMFIQNKHAVKASKQRFESLCKSRSCLSADAVMNKILFSLKDKSISRFK